jgi:ubiquinone biosynthesis protein UbiJ
VAVVQFTWLGTYGRVMCMVQIAGDTRSTRNIWLASIKPIKKATPPAETDDTESANKGDGRWKADGAAEYTNAEQTVLVPKRQLENLLEDVTTLKDKISDLEKKLNEMLLLSPTNSN